MRTITQFTPNSNSSKAADYSGKRSQPQILLDLRYFDLTEGKVRWIPENLEEAAEEEKTSGKRVRTATAIEPPLGVCPGAKFFFCACRQSRISGSIARSHCATSRLPETSCRKDVVLALRRAVMTRSVTCHVTHPMNRLVLLFLRVRGQRAVALSLGCIKLM